jgi:cyclophilin family peptidyl-prolyl cis-trans isomerase
MPKAASKRTKARRSARVSRAHQTTLDRSRQRVRPAARRKRQAGLAAFVGDYPWATTLFVVLLVGGILGVLYTNHLAFWAAPARAAHCDLKTHTCQRPPQTIDPNKRYVATIKTARGDIVIALDAKDDPVTVNNFVYLADQHFYDGLTFWRVDHKGKPSVVSAGAPSDLDLIQGGDPKKNGTGGPGYSLPDEKVVGAYTAGAVAMARATSISGSQFFICTGDDSAPLAKSYNLFGRVTSGLDVAQQIQPGDKMESVRIAVSNAPTPTPKK